MFKLFSTSSMLVVNFMMGSLVQSTPAKVELSGGGNIMEKFVFFVVGIFVLAL